MSLLDSTSLVDSVPLIANGDGTILIKGTRVPIDTVLIALKEGATAEEIIQQYPVVSLADVYAVIGSYLHQKEKVEAYLSTREQEAARVRSENEKRFTTGGFRERLLNRQKAKR
jgi:uncharacterized protein (DUF433 family)